MNRKTAAELGKYAWGQLAPQNQYLQKAGKVLKTPEENVAELTAQAGDFLKRLPTYRALKLV